MREKRVFDAPLYCQLQAASSVNNMIQLRGRKHLTMTSFIPSERLARSYNVLHFAIGPPV